jgi:hypothetical protein
MAFVLICVFAVPHTLFAAGSDNQYSPNFLPGGLLAWFICSRRKRKPIGGWLSYYYWQVYAGILMTVLFFAGNIQSYVYENFDSTSRYVWFLSSTVPYTVLLIIECAAATLLLTVRNWDMLKLVRWTILGQLISAVVSTGIDAVYFKDNVVFGLLNIATAAIWYSYFRSSTRIRHVFLLHDWDKAVDSIHPISLNQSGA